MLKYLLLIFISIVVFFVAAKEVILGKTESSSVIFQNKRV